MLIRACSALACAVWLGRHGSSAVLCSQRGAVRRKSHWRGVWGGAVAARLVDGPHVVAGDLGF